MLNFIILIFLNLLVCFPYFSNAQPNILPDVSSPFFLWQTQTDKVFNEIMEESLQKSLLTQKDKNIFYEILSERKKSFIGVRVDSAFKNGKTMAIHIIEEFNSKNYSHKTEERYFDLGNHIPNIVHGGKPAQHALLDIDGWPHRSLNTIKRHSDSLKKLDYLYAYKFIGGKVFSWDSDKYLSNNYKDFENYRPKEYRIETLIQKDDYNNFEIKISFILPAYDEKQTVIIDIQDPDR